MPPVSTPLTAPADVVEFARGLELFEDRPALISRGQATSYAELAARAGRRAGELDDLTGALQRRLVLIALDRTVDAIATYLAALRAGHVALLAPATDIDLQRELIATYDPDVIARRIDSSWTVHSQRPGSTHTLHHDLAVLLSTSGSTGSPKLVRLSHENLQANADSIVEALTISADHRAVSTLPLTYSYGLSVLHSHLNVGASMLLTDDSVVDARFWDDVAEHRVTTLPGVPHTFELLDRVGFDRQRLPHLRHLTVAGGRLAPDRVRHYAELGSSRGFDLHVMYGQTEATARIATLPPQLAASAPDSIGAAIPGGSIELIPVAGAGPDVGELAYRGPNVMLGYAESIADLALGRTVDALHTGDLATKSADGTYRIVGRRSRIAKVFGLRIDLDRVEQLLAQDGITASAMSDDTGLCVLAEGRVDRHYVADRAARASGLPLHVVHARVVERLPRLDNGKLDRAAAADQCHTAPSASTVTPPANTSNAATGDGIAALYANLLGRPDATADDSFVALGGDSLSFVEVSVRLEAMLGELPADWHLRSPVELASRQSPKRRHRWTAQLDTGVALRALAIIAIVGTHIGAFALLGGAHVLLGLAGFSMARFLLTSDREPRAPKVLRSALRIAVPSIAFIAIVAVLTTTYTWQNALLVGTYLGPESWGPAWHYWFIEALVLYLLVCAALFAIPAFDRAERAAPFLVPAVLVAVGLVIRFGAMPGLAETRPSPAPGVYFFWFFALGWWAARTTTTWQRLLVSAVVLVAVPGYWDAPLREGAVVVGLLVLIWFRTVRVPRVSVPVLTRLAAASLAIYLTHWLVFPQMADLPWVALVVSLAVGVAVYDVGRVAMKAAKSLSFWSAYVSPYSTNARSARSPLPR